MIHISFIYNIKTAFILLLKAKLEYIIVLAVAAHTYDFPNAYYGTNHICCIWEDNPETGLC